MRHNDAGLAIPDFPLAFGQLIPPHWDLKIALHFAHRVGALIVTILVLATTGHVFYHHRRRPELVRPSALLLVLLAVQITLGALTVLSGTRPHHQLAARRDWRAGAGHVARPDAAGAPRALCHGWRAISFSSRRRPSRSAWRAMSARPAGMKTHAAAVASVPAAGERVQHASRTADFVALTKPRLNLLVLVTTLAGVYLAAPDGVPLPLLLHTLVGTALVAGGAAALNQVLGARDRQPDAAHERPPAAGRPAARGEGAWFGALLSTAGIAELAIRGQCALGRRRRAHARELRVRLHADEAPHARCRRWSAPFRGRCRR